MPAKYNKGEWAELYVLAKILCDGKLSVGKYELFAQSRDLQVADVARVSRPGEASGERFEVVGDTVKCSHNGRTISRAQLCASSEALLKEIRNGKGAFGIGPGNQLLELLGIDQLKTSNEKADVFIDVVDPLTGSTGMQGYTIKSFLGSKPTLLNASKSTNFTFEVRPTPTEWVLRETATDGLRERLCTLVGSGYQLVMTDMDSAFKENLKLLDSLMPDVIAELLIAHYTMRVGPSAAVDETVSFLARTNPMKVTNPTDFYQHKVKDLLEAVAYGLTPTKPWNGGISAPGGLLIVERTGDLISIPQGNRDAERKFLLDSTRFEIASKTRHDFGVITTKDSKCIVRLNLQIRYK
jgi:hypothetical protein